jgi:anti-anti-sigma factor
MRGWLDAQGESALLTTVQDAGTQGAKYLVLNMADIEMLTSAGIRALQKLYKQYTPSEGSPTVHLRLCSAQPQVYRVLALTGFLQTMPMYETLHSALISFEA